MRLHILQLQTIGQKEFFIVRKIRSNSLDFIVFSVQ